MATRKLTKRIVDAAAPKDARYIVWDADLKGFGLRVEESGTKTYLLRYRPRNAGAKGPKRFLTIGRHGALTPEQAREQARAVLGAVANGADPALDRATAKGRPTLAATIEDFTRLHVEPKLKPTTAEAYRSIFKLYVLPEWGRRRADELGKADLLRLHARMSAQRATANRILNYLSAAYSWAGENGYVPTGTNPATGIERYGETRRERFLSVVELDRLGAAIREAETIGIPWEVDEAAPKAKHTPKAERQTPISPQAAAALRLLLFTGARLREILHLQWKHVDIERAAVFLPDSKTGKKTIYLNGPALTVLQGLPRLSDPTRTKRFPLPATDVVQRIGMLDAKCEMMVAKQKVVGTRRRRRWLDLYIDASESDSEEMPPAGWDASKDTGRQLCEWSNPGEWLSDDVIEEVYSVAERQRSLVGRVIEGLQRLEIFAEDVREQVTVLPTFEASRPTNSHHDILMERLEPVFLRLGGGKWGDQRCSEFAAHVAKLLPKEATATAAGLIQRRKRKRQAQRG